MKKNKKRILKIFIIILIVLIISVGVFFGIKEYKEWRFKKNVQIFQQGVNYGYAQALIQIINVSDSCKPFPVYVGNETRELISVTCYKNT